MGPTSLPSHSATAETSKREKRILAPLRKFAKPVADVIQPLPYTVLQSMLDEAAPAGIQNYWKSAYITGLSDEAIDTILSHGKTITSPLSAIHLHHLGGAMQRIGDDATAFSHRDAPHLLNIVSGWENPAENEKHIKWTRDFFTAMQTFSTGAYVNFLGEEGMDRVKEAYDKGKYAKLVALKDKYDPDQLLPSQPEHQPIAFRQVTPGTGRGRSPPVFVNFVQEMSAWSPGVRKGEVGQRSAPRGRARCV